MGRPPLPGYLPVLNRLALPRCRWRQPVQVAQILSRPFELKTIIIVVLSGVVWFTGKWSNPLLLSSRTWLLLGLSGLATGTSCVCSFRALQVGEASKVAPVDKLSLVPVAIFAFAFPRERPSLREWTGIAMVAAGVLVLAIKR